MVCSEVPPGHLSALHLAWMGNLAQEGGLGQKPQVPDPGSLADNLELMAF